MKLVNEKLVRLQGFKVMDFVGQKGEKVEYALATIIDETGGIVEVSADAKLNAGGSVPCDGYGTYDVFMGSNKEGKRVAKHKLTSFKIAK